MHKLILLPVVAAPPAIVAMWMQQAKPALGVSMESSVILKLIETSVVGAALFVTLWLVWRMVQKMDDQTVRSEAQTVRYEALAERMRLTIEKDIESRGAITGVIEELGKTKLCIYTREEYAKIAAEVSRLQRAHGT